MILLITYDLHKPDRDYAAVEKVLKSTGAWLHLEESVWLVETQESSSRWVDKLMALSKEATYFAVPVTSSWASYGLDKGQAEWLKSPYRRW